MSSGKVSNHLAGFGAVRSFLERDQPTAIQDCHAPDVGGASSLDVRSVFFEWIGLGPAASVEVEGVASGRLQRIWKERLIRFCRNESRRGTVMAGKAISVKKYVVSLELHPQTRQLARFGWVRTWCAFLAMSRPPHPRSAITHRGSRRLGARPQSIKEDVRYFLDGFTKCAENRNVLMHSTVMYLFGPDDEPCPAVSPPHKQPKGLAFQKSPKGNPFQINTYQVTIEEIRAVADTIQSFQAYGDELFWHIWKTYETASFLASGLPESLRSALPSRPVLPTLVTPLPHDAPKGS
jgi:hypothetical protein